MKRYSFFLRLRTIFVCVSLVAFGSCTDLDLVEEGQSSESVTSANISGVSKMTDQGTSYLGKDFYLNSTDNVTTVATRAGESEAMLMRSFSIVAKSIGEVYLGVHVMGAYIDENRTLQQIGVLVNDEYVGELDVKKAEWDFVTLKDESIKTDWEKYQYDSQGAYIAPTPEMFLKKYAKGLINAFL